MIITGYRAAVSKELPQAKSASAAQTAYVNTL